MDKPETPINDAERRPRRPIQALESVWLGALERVLWPLGDFLRPLGRALRTAFEAAAWPLRRGLIWPLQDRFAKLGTPARAATGLAAALVVAVGVLAVIGASGDEDPVSEPVAAAETVPAPAPVETPPPAAAEPEPTLQGAAPVFEPEPAAKSASKGGGQAVQSAPADSDPATATIGSGPATSSSAAGAASTSKSQNTPVPAGQPAGPEAIAVAREFADAFVLYETGGDDTKVREAFRATATEELAKSLLRRPPRQPAGIEVPKAKVVNVVAGPSQGPVYSVSVSLLRVGVTSELRLDMEELKKDQWRVTNVLG